MFKLKKGFIYQSHHWVSEVNSDIDVEQQFLDAIVSLTTEKRFSIGEVEDTYVELDSSTPWGKRNKQKRAIVIRYKGVFPRPRAIYVANNFGAYASFFCFMHGMNSVTRVSVTDSLKNFDSLMNLLAFESICELALDQAVHTLKLSNAEKKL